MWIIMSIYLYIHFVANRVDLTPLLITLVMAGKFGITGSFAVMILYAKELFPTTLRYIFITGYNIALYVVYQNKIVHEA